MKHLSYFFISFIIITLCFTGCKKDNWDYTLEGKWKVSDVYYMDRDVVLHGIHKPNIDFTENLDIIYDFQKNNKLVITTTYITGEIKQSEYSYTYQQGGYHPYSNPPVKYEGCYYLQIDTNKFSCLVSPGGGKSLEITGFSNCNGTVTGVIDEIDLEILKYDEITSWIKSFDKLK